ncbi:mitochondrial import protein Zim17 [Aspergillus cavernicola]|uniref:Mitochondrial import protein Zim17 n=1 Tax=Aspergillus cavernicola TaxID=176166 RepID=A0ABR4IJT3_9EURO
MQQTLCLSRSLRALHSSLPQPAISRVSRGASSRLYSQLTSNCHFTRLLVPTNLHKSSRIVPIPQITARFNSDTSSSRSPSPLTDRSSDPETDARNEAENRLRREQEPAYQLTFTCKPCGDRSSHRISKHGFHRGTVLIRCPGCENRHVISDNLKIFLDNTKNLDDLLSEQGQKITRGEVQGDMEFWDDGTVTKRGENETKSAEHETKLE